MATNGVLDLFALSKQVAFVTGGGRGLGRAICVGFAEAGADIVAVSRTAKELEETARQVRARGRRCLTIPCDVTVQAQVQAAVDRAVKEFGRIDILVNNAGGVHDYYVLEELTEAEWDKQTSINLKAAVLCSLAAGKVMLRQGRGKIINIASICSFQAMPGIAPYNAAKAGLVMFTKQVATEWGDRGIWANAIASGGMDTLAPEKLLGSMVRRGMDKPTYLASDPNKPPVKICMAQPEEYVPIALFLASAASNHLTGDVLSPGGVALLRT